MWCHSRWIGTINNVGLQGHQGFLQHWASEWHNAHDRSRSSLHLWKKIRHCLRCAALPNPLSSIWGIRTWRSTPWYLEVVEAVQSSPCARSHSRLARSIGDWRRWSRWIGPCESTLSRDLLWTAIKTNTNGWIMHKNAQMLQARSSLSTTACLLSALCARWSLIRKKIIWRSFWVQINQFYEIFFWQNSIFWQFQKWPKIIFLTGKKFKTAKNAISCKKNLI